MSSRIVSCVYTLKPFFFSSKTHVAKLKSFNLIWMLRLTNSLAQFDIFYFILHIRITFPVVLIESLTILS